MEYVYAAMLLHAAEKEMTEDNITAVLKAAGVDVDGAALDVWLHWKAIPRTKQDAACACPQGPNGSQRGPNGPQTK